MPDILAAVLHYAAGNTPVFPVNFADKHPLCPHGLKDATIDEGQIRTWWRIYPCAMIGIAAGPRSGVWVLDVDVDLKKGINGHKTLARLESEHGPLPRAAGGITYFAGTALLSAAAQQRSEPVSMSAATADTSSLRLACASTEQPTAGKTRTLLSLKRPRG